MRGLVEQSGIGVATRNTVRALKEQGVDVTNDPADSYDLLHLQWIGPLSLYHARRAHRQGRPVALTVHTTPDLLAGAFTLSGTLTPVYRRYLRWFMRNVDLMITPTEAAAAQILPLVDGKPVHAFSGGIDCVRFSFAEKSRIEFRRKHDLHRPTVVAVGQVIPRKGVETFFEVARLIPEADFLWIGPSVSPFLFYSPRFSRALRHKPSNVRLLGFEPDIERAYCGSDVFFHPSHAESLGLVILEAASVGLPLVVRRLPVYEGWLHEGRNCLMGDSTAQFVSAISALIHSELPLLSRNGLLKRHSLDVAGRDLIAAYREVL